MGPFSLLTTFRFEGRDLPVRFREKDENIAAGVTGYDYDIVGNERWRDLAIIVVEKGYRTPRQIMRHGYRTVEGWYAGRGVFEVLRGAEGSRPIRYFVASPFDNTVRIGDIMQWFASDDADLVFFEVCESPPYEPGRFENLPEAE